MESRGLRVPEARMTERHISERGRKMTPGQRHQRWNCHCLSDTLYCRAAL